MPIGLKLPYDPVSFLKKSEIKQNDFYVYLLKKTKELLDEGIMETIFVFLDVKYQSVKKIQNSDIIVGIDMESTIKVQTDKKVRLSNDPSAQPVLLSEENMLNQFPFTYKELVIKVRQEISNFKVGKVFYNILKETKNNKTIFYNNVDRKLNKEVL